MSTEYITYISHMRGEGGDTRLLAGTRSRLYVNTGLDGNWKLLYAGAGGVRPEDGVPEARWRSAQVGAITLFTNGVDRPLYWAYEAELEDGQSYAAKTVDDLVAMDITSARVIGSWRGVVFLGNTVTEGTTNTNRIYWSDFNDPLSFTPLPDSLAGYVDLGADERVLAMAPIGGQFRVYTDKAIYDVNLVGGSEVFNFREIYRGPSALRFENSLVNVGAFHVYGGEDTLYVLGELDRSPQLLDWMYKASGAIYNGVSAEYLDGIPESTFWAYSGVNRSACHNFIGGYSEEGRQIWFSWCADGELVPARSLVLQMDRMKACIMDSGFTAFCSHLPAYQLSVRGWLADVGACDPRGSIPDNEGNPCQINAALDASLTCIRNPTEDPLLATSSDSLCYKVNSDPSIEPDCTPCGNGYVFVMASAVDKCLKRYDPDYYAREFCTTLPESSRSGLVWSTTDHPTTQVTYADSGYVTIVQTDSQDMGVPTNKTVQRFAVEYDSADVPDNAAALLHADVGYGAQPRHLIWQTSTPRPIDRLAVAQKATLLSTNRRPNRMATYQFYRTGQQIGMRLMVADANRGPVTGGAVSLNEMTVGMRVSHGDYY